MSAQVVPGREHAPGPLARYLVEVSPSAEGLPSVQTMSVRARQAASEVARDGLDVRFLRLLFVPHDGSCLLLYEGASEAVIRRAVTAAGLDPRSISGAVGLTVDERRD